MQTKTRDDFLRSIIAQHTLSLKKSLYHYQVTYCETRYSHRTINFEIDTDHQQMFLEVYAQFEDEIKVIDSDVVAVKLQEVPPHALEACRIIADKENNE